MYIKCLYNELIMAVLMQTAEQSWASIIGWTGGQVPTHFLKWGDVMCFVPHFLGQQICIMCKFTILLLLILREMDISLGRWRSPEFRFASLGSWKWQFWPTRAVSVV